MGTDDMMMELYTGQSTTPPATMETVILAQTYRLVDPMNG